MFGRLAINSGIACMLDWLKRKSTSSAPSEQLLESEDQPPLTDERLGRMLGRLGSDSRTRSEPAAEVLNRIDPLPGTDGRAAGEPAAEALNEIDQPPSTDSGTAGEPAAQALNEVDQPPSADNRAEGRFTLSHADLTITRRGHGPSAAELLAKGYSFAAGPDGKMLIFDAAGHQVDTALPSSDSTAASEPAAEAVSEIAPQPSIDSVAASEPAAEAVSEIAPQPSIDSVAASEPAAEAVTEIDPLPSTDSMAASEPAAEAVSEIDPLAATDTGTASEPVAEALNEITPLPRARKRTVREPAAEASDEINPPPRTDRKAAGAPGQMVVIAVSSQKGGSGKTTIAAHLAVQAGAAGHGPVVLIDTDPQGSLAEWWQARADETPALATVKPEELAANLAELRSYGTAIAIIDTPPALTGSIEQVIAMADLILIPRTTEPARSARCRWNRRAGAKGGKTIYVHRQQRVAPRQHHRASGRGALRAWAGGAGHSLPAHRIRRFDDRWPHRHGNGRFRPIGAGNCRVVAVRICANRHACGGVGDHGLRKTLGRVACAQGCADSRNRVGAAVAPTPAPGPGPGREADGLLARHLKLLKLPTFLREYDKLARQCAADGLDPSGYLLRLAELELIERERRMVERRIKEARFPAVKSLDSFDFAAVPSLDKNLVLELARCEYVARRENIIAIGNSGTGKTHIALGLGLAACQKGLSVGFITAASLMHELLEARDEQRLLRLQRRLAGYKVLIIDELGYVPLSTAGAELLFEVFSQRYERGSTIITSNLPFEEWINVFGTARLTGAVLDRLTHRVHILEMKGESYRHTHSEPPQPQRRGNEAGRGKRVE